MPDAFTRRPHLDWVQERRELESGEPVKEQMRLWLQRFASVTKTPSILITEAHLGTLVPLTDADLDRPARLAEVEGFLCSHGPGRIELYRTPRVGIYVGNDRMPGPFPESGERDLRLSRRLPDIRRVGFRGPTFGL